MATSHTLDGAFAHRAPAQRCHLRIRRIQLRAPMRPARLRLQPPRPWPGECGPRRTRWCRPHPPGTVSAAPADAMFATAFGSLLVDPEVDGYGDELLLICFTHDDGNGRQEPSALLGADQDERTAANG